MHILSSHGPNIVLGVSTKSRSTGRGLGEIGNGAKDLVTSGGPD